MSIKFFLAAILTVMPYILMAQSGQPINVTGEQLIGRTENGQPVREVLGNVVLVQGNVTITCDRAIQYLSQNNARLIGNVIVRQNNLTIKTPEGFYDGNERRAFSDRGVTLNDGKVILSARIGEYFFKEDKADFRSNVVLTDTLSTLTSAKLLYYQKRNFAIATGYVRIEDSVNTIICDSLEHFREEQKTFCFGNVTLKNRIDNTVIQGKYAEDFRLEKKSKVTGNAILIQIDSIYSAQADSVTAIDTLIIRAMYMESDRSSEDKFIAVDSVRILRGSFASLNDKTYFNKSAGKILTYKLNDSSHKPVIWYDNSQLSGDTIDISMTDNKISKIAIQSGAFLLSVNAMYPVRFDQIAGREMLMHFSDNVLSYTEIFNNVLAIYYVYEEEAGNGVIKASGLNAALYFKDKKVETVKFSGEPASEYHPEVLLAGNEKSFTLPGFFIKGGRPDRDDMLNLPGRKK